MTQEQTRQLGIEFERRLQTMYPQAETIDKLDTDTIYSFLSEYQMKYISNIFSQYDNIKSSTVANEIVDEVLSSLLDSEDLTPDESGKFYKSNIDDYFRYVRSETTASKTYKGTGTFILTNKLSKSTEAKSIANRIADTGFILRNPIIELANDEFKLYVDGYTTVTKLTVYYYKEPNSFNVMPNETLNVLNTCCLPFVCFDDLVSGAVQLYMTYKTNVDLMKNDASKKALKNLTGNNKEDNQ